MTALGMDWTGQSIQYHSFCKPDLSAYRASMMHVDLIAIGHTNASHRIAQFQHDVIICSLRQAMRARCTLDI